MVGSVCLSDGFWFGRNQTLLLLAAQVCLVSCRGEMAFLLKCNERVKFNLKRHPLRSASLLSTPSTPNAVHCKKYILNAVSGTG